MSNEYCVGVIGFRSICNYENQKSNDELSTNDFAFCMNQDNTKRLFKDVEKTPDFFIKSIDDTRLGLFFKPGSENKSQCHNDEKYRIVKQFFDIPGPKTAEAVDVEQDVAQKSASENSTPSTFDVYSMLHEAHKDECKTNHAMDPPRYLLPILRPYQSNALQWMLKRERVSHDQEFVPVKCFAIPNKLFYYNDRTMELFDYEPTIPTGGILADEMGLGKSVEVLALILSNPNLKRKLSDCVVDATSAKLSPSTKTTLRCICADTTNDAKKPTIQCSKCSHLQHTKCVNVNKHTKQSISSCYLCPDCWKLEEPLRSSTTFIICPPTIRVQWYKEIQKHISCPHFKVLVYEGIHRDGWISPADLATFDVVLCDYTVMRAEIQYASPTPSYNYRTRKSIIMTSPLVKLKWYRVVLDEAQMVESPTNRCSKMVKKLPAVHRWAVTGTPIEKSVDDLYGLMVFLDFEPYTDRDKWNALIESFNKGNARPLIDRCLKKIMWRNCKSNVITEMDIPKQQEIVHNIKLNELEARFYFDQHAKFESEFYENVDKLTQQHGGVLKMNAVRLKTIMEPLRKLRVDCTVPTVMEKTSKLSRRRMLETRTELYEVMVETNKSECSAMLESIASQVNCQALSLLQNHNRNAAIKLYELILRLTGKFKENSFRVISMSTVAALNSLLSIIDSWTGNDFDVRSVKADCLMEIARLEGDYSEKINLTSQLKYMIKKQSELENSILACDNCTFNRCTRDDCTSHWWSDFLEEIDEDVQKQIVDAINKQLITESFQISVTSCQDVRDTLHSWIDAMQRERSNVKNVFKEYDFFAWIPEPPISLAVALAQNDEHKGFRVGNAFKSKNHVPLICHKYKVAKILPKYKNLLYERSGGASHQELMLKEILKLIRNDERKTTNATRHFRYIDLLKQEFQAYEKYLQKINDFLQILIEPKVHTSKLKATTNSDAFNYQIQAAEQQLRIGKYVGHLEKNKPSGTEECPICLELPCQFECILECGHKMCVNCFLQIKKSHPILYRCHSCRYNQLTENSYLLHIEQSSRTMINGNYSKKIQEIVRTALDLRQCDPDVKILIFTQWFDITRLLAQALSHNGVLNCGEFRNLDTCLDEFKDKDKKVTCLLLSLKNGSKGLNIIEATHVFLVEPILDPAEELQAIGRIHRIGQNKPTFVHRFIVLNTIEETIFNTTSKDMSGKWKTTKVTVDSLKKLFTRHRQID